MEKDIFSMAKYNWGGFKYFFTVKRKRIIRVLREIDVN